MKRVLNSKIFLIIICGIIFTNLGIYASNLYSAKDIIYQNEKSEINNVNDALDELYKTASESLKIKKIQLGNGGSDRRANSIFELQNDENYKTLKVGSRTSSLATSMVFSIYGYDNLECSTGETELLFSNSNSTEIETFNISQYKCIRFSAYSYMNVDGYQRFNDVELKK